MPNKVRAYIFNKDNSLLVFTEPDFPEAGTQVPGGTVDEGESFLDALIREVEEETGHKINGNWQKIYSETITHPVNLTQQTEHVYLIRGISHLPETWEHSVTGGGEDEGITFKYSWVDTSFAMTNLWPWMSKQLARCLKCQADT